MIHPLFFVVRQFMQGVFRIVKILHSYKCNMKKLLPDDLFNLITSLVDQNMVYEIRIRNRSPICVNVAGEYRVLSQSGFAKSASDAWLADEAMIDYILAKATNNSVYSVNNQIKQGFVTFDGGIRIGISGETVIDGEGVKTIKNISSLNIRIPHEIRNCAMTALNFILQTGVKNTLIISPPGAGKTTFLRDIARGLSMSKKIKNTLIVDERYEIAASTYGYPTMDVGSFTDVISGSSKTFGLREGLRSLKPNVIVCDEIATSDDLDAVAEAMSSGVKVIASAHAFDHVDLSKKPQFAEVFKKKLFQRFVVISERNGPGTYEGIFDENFSCLYFPE